MTTHRMLLETQRKMSAKENALAGVLAECEPHMVESLCVKIKEAGDDHTKLVLSLAPHEVVMLLALGREQFMRLSLKAAIKVFEGLN